MFIFQNSSSWRLFKKIDSRKNGEKVIFHKRNENKFLQISIHKLTMDRDIFIFEKSQSAK